MKWIDKAKQWSTVEPQNFSDYIISSYKYLDDFNLDFKTVTVLVPIKHITNTGQPVYGVIVAEDRNKNNPSGTIFDSSIYSYLSSFKDMAQTRPDLLTKAKIKVSISLYNSLNMANIIYKELN